MPQPNVDNAFKLASSTHPASMNRDELAEYLAHLQVVRSWVDAAEISANRRGRELADAGSAGSAESAHIRAGNRSEREARTVTDRTDLCDHMPSFESALSAGTVSSGHVDAIARAAGRLDDVGRDRLAASAEAYLDQATRSTVDAFDRAMREAARAINAATAGDTAADELSAQRSRSNVKRWVDRGTGMHHTLLELDPLRDAALWTAIDTQLAADRSVNGNSKTPWSELRVQAVVNAVTASGGTDRRPEVGVLIDYQRLVDTATATGLCETVSGIPLPAETVRRLCCDAEVYPIVLGTASEVLDAGRMRRTASRSQRRALAAIHRTCAHPDCTAGFDVCRLHHVQFWTDQRGPTDLDNLLPLCERHHHLVHEGRWTLTMCRDRVATWTRPDNSVHAVGSTIDRVQPAPVMSSHQT